MKLAIVGQPGIGKSTLTHILEFQYPEQIVLVPDKMDVIKKDFLPEAKNISGQKSYQKALFYFQRELEDLVSSGANEKLVVCDGCALDTLKYWPSSTESFFDDIHSSLKKELARYDWILHIYSVNTETKIHSNLPINEKNIWALHPRYISVPIGKEFNISVKNVSNILHQIFEKVPYNKIVGASINEIFVY